MKANIFLKKGEKTLIIIIPVYFYPQRFKSFFPQSRILETQSNYSIRLDHLIVFALSRCQNEQIESVLLFNTQSRLLTTLNDKAFENIVGKGENTGNQQFFLFPQFFLPYPKQVLIFYLNLFCPLQML